MGRFIEGADRRQATLLPETIDDYVGEENPVRVIDAFVDMLDLAALGFNGVVPEETGRPSYHPATMLKIYVYGYLNQVQSSRGLERECHRNLELIWLTGRLAPDFKTIADFRRDNGRAIRRVCAKFVALCRNLHLLDVASVAIDTLGKERRVSRWEHEDVLERAQERLDRRPDAMIVRRSTVEHPFASIKAWMGATHFRMKTLKHVATEIALHVLAYNLKRVMAILGVPALLRAM
jgi:transposase